MPGPGDSSRGPSRFPLGKPGEASEDDLNQPTIGAPPELRAATKAPATAQGVRRKSEDPTVPALEGRPKPGPEAPETPRPSAGGRPVPSIPNDATVASEPPPLRRPVP